MCGSLGVGVAILGLMPFCSGSAPRADTDLAAVKKQLVDTWVWPGKTTSLLLHFGATGELTISMRLSDGWLDSKTKYKLLDPTTLEVVVGGYLFPNSDITQKWEMRLTEETLRLKMPGGQWLSFKRRD